MVSEVVYLFFDRPGVEEIKLPESSVVSEDDTHKNMTTQLEFVVRVQKSVNKNLRPLRVCFVFLPLHVNTFTHNRAECTHKLMKIGCF